VRDLWCKAEGEYDATSLNGKDEDMANRRNFHITENWGRNRPAQISKVLRSIHSKESSEACRRAAEIDFLE
jgi:hypothetical protein